MHTPRPHLIMQLAERGFERTEVTFSWYHDLWSISKREWTKATKSEKQLPVLNSVSYLWGPLWVAGVGRSPSPLSPSLPVARPRGCKLRSGILLQVACGLGAPRRRLQDTESEENERSDRGRGGRKKGRGGKEEGREEKGDREEGRWGEDEPKKEKGGRARRATRCWQLVGRGKRQGWVL